VPRWEIARALAGAGAAYAWLLGVGPANPKVVRPRKGDAVSEWPVDWAAFAKGVGRPR
jgi:hypothetical protein